MALSLGTNSGFVTTAPTADPNGTAVTSDGSSFVTKHTSPANAVRITEVGWYKASGTTSSNCQVGLYSESAGVAATRLQVTGDAGSGTTAGWKVFSGLNWEITENTAYWLGMQQDAHTGSSTIDSAASGGAGIDTRTSQTALTNPYGGGAVSDADGMYAIYALVEFATTTTTTTATPTTTTTTTVAPTTTTTSTTSSVIASSTTGVSINIGDVWKNVNSIKINIGDVWKDVISGWINIGDVWKSLIVPEFSLTWDDIANVPVADETSVSDWNTFFDLPTNGTAFTSVIVEGNKVIFFGGGGITLKNLLFYANTNIISFIDTKGLVVYALDNCLRECSYLATISFSGLLTSGSNTFQDCIRLTSLSAPSLTDVGDYCFATCSAITSINLPSLDTTGIYAFYNCNDVITFSATSLVTLGAHGLRLLSSCTTFTLLLLETAGTYAFESCSSNTIFDLPSLISIGSYGFSGCTSATTFDLPECTTIGDVCFYLDDAMTSLYIPSCTALGSSVGSNSIFSAISGNTIALTVPSALMTCNSGNPDGDIQDLQAANTVNITQV